MVWEWKCHSIVMLTELQEREQVSCTCCQQATIDDLLQQRNVPVCADVTFLSQNCSYVLFPDCAVFQRLSFRILSYMKLLTAHVCFCRTNVSNTGPQRTRSPTETTQ